MGSFNATCSITDLGLDCGAPMYMMLILPFRVGDDRFERIEIQEKGLRVSNDSPFNDFVPFGFAIEGEYSDYGMMTNIKRDKNVEMLEEFFGMTIDTIFNCATDDRWYTYGYLEREDRVNNMWIVNNNEFKHLNILKHLTVTYFRKEAYDFLCKNHIGDDDTYEKKWRDAHLAKMKEVLTSLDGVPTPDNTKKIKPEDVTEKQLDAVKKLFENSGEKDVSDDQLRDLAASLVRNKSSRFDMFNRENRRYLGIPDIVSINMFEVLPIDSEYLNECVKLSNFRYNMMKLFKNLRPSNYGSQEDNYEFYSKFNKHMNRVVNKEIKELIAEREKYGDF